MKKLRICSVLLIVLLSMGGTAFAFDATDHVKVAPNGTGDLLIFPWYYVPAGGGWQNKLTVINTSNTISTVAKVVVRSHNFSKELVDFLIYLSPNDVWTGILTTRTDGTYIISTDDSCLRQAPVGDAVAGDFASVASPFTQKLFSIPASCGTADSVDKGYVEVIESASTTIAKISGKVAKPVIHKWYTALADGAVAPNYPQNILTGYHEWSSTTNTTYHTLARIAVFADWDNLLKLTTGAVTGLSSESNNTIGELEAAMSKSDVAMPYINYATGEFAVHIFNFPTKMSLEGISTCTWALRTSPTRLVSPYFTALCDTYTNNIYDLTETTTSTPGVIVSGGTTDTFSMCKELEYLLTNFSDSIFREGWVRYNWGRGPLVKAFVAKDTVTDGTYTGVPVLPSILYFNGPGVNIVSEAAPAFENGIVTEGATLQTQAPYPYYQYSEPQPED